MRRRICVRPRTGCARACSTFCTAAGTATRSPARASSTSSRAPARWGSRRCRAARRRSTFVDDGRRRRPCHPRRTSRRPARKARPPSSRATPPGSVPAPARPSTSSSSTRPMARSWASAALASARAGGWIAPEALMVWEESAPPGTARGVRQARRAPLRRHPRHASCGRQLLPSARRRRTATPAAFVSAKRLRQTTPDPRPRPMALDHLALEPVERRRAGHHRVRDRSWPGDREAVVRGLEAAGDAIAAGLGTEHAFLDEGAREAGRP